MKAVTFPGVNRMIGKEQPQYLQLPAMRLPGDDGEVIVCFELSEEELETIQRTKKIYVKQLTFNTPYRPIMPLVDLADGYEIPESANT